MSQQIPEKVAAMSWIFLLVVLLVLCSVGVGLLCSCSGRFTVDGSALPHLMRDYERASHDKS